MGSNRIKMVKGSGFHFICLCPDEKPLSFTIRERLHQYVVYYARTEPELYPVFQQKIS